MTLADPIIADPAAAPDDGPRAFRWTRDEYYRLLDQGMFDGRRVELVDGEILEMPAQKDAHAWSVGASEDELRAVAGPGHWVRCQMPLHLSEWSDPEPDVAVVVGDRASWKGNGHPKSALLVVEVSEKTLAFDRKLRQAIYAAAGLREYWIVNLVDQRLEVHRDPVPDPQNALASRYASVTLLAVGEFVVPRAFPAARVAVADLIA